MWDEAQKSCSGDGGGVLTKPTWAQKQGAEVQSQRNLRALNVKGGKDGVVVAAANMLQEKVGNTPGVALGR